MEIFTLFAALLAVLSFSHVHGLDVEVPGVGNNVQPVGPGKENNAVGAGQEGSLNLEALQAAYIQLQDSTNQLTGALKVAQKEGNKRAVDIMAKAQGMAGQALDRLQGAKSQGMRGAAAAVENALQTSALISGRLEEAGKDAGPDLGNSVRAAQNSFLLTGSQIRDGIINFAAAGQSAAQNLVAQGQNLANQVLDNFGNFIQGQAGQGNSEAGDSSGNGGLAGNFQPGLGVGGNYGGRPIISAGNIGGGGGGGFSPGNGVGGALGPLDLGEYNNNLGFGKK